MSVLKKIDKEELAFRKQNAELEFRSATNGYGAHTFTDYNHSFQQPGGNTPKGGIEEILCNTAFEIIPTYQAKVSEGYSLNEQLGTVSFGASAFLIYMHRPEADIKKDLVQVFKQVESNYAAEVETSNTAIIEKEIASQIEREIRLEEEVIQEAAQARRERITAEVKAALGAKQ